MDSPWVGVVGALGGVLVGTMAEAIRAKWSFQREKLWDAFDEQRRHLEATYETLEQLRDSYGQGVGGVMFAVMQGKPRVALSDSKAPWGRLRMLVHLYAPWLVGQLAEVERTGPLLGEAMASSIAEQSGDKRRDAALVDQLLLVSGTFSRSVDAMRDAIVASSRRIDEEAAQMVAKTGARIVVAPEPPVLEDGVAGT